MLDCARLINGARRDFSAGAETTRCARGNTSTRRRRDAGPRIQTSKHNLPVERERPIIVHHHHPRQPNLCLCAVTSARRRPHESLTNRRFAVSNESRAVFTREASSHVASVHMRVPRKLYDLIPLTVRDA